MKEKMTRVEILTSMQVGEHVARTGSVVDMMAGDAIRQKAMGRARDAAPGAKVHYITKEEFFASAKANATEPGAVQTREPRVRSRDPQ